MPSREARNICIGRSQRHLLCEGVDFKTMCYAGNFAQCYVAAWMGRELGEEWIHVYVWLSHCVHPTYHNIVYQLGSNKNRKCKQKTQTKTKPWATQLKVSYLLRRLWLQVGHMLSYDEFREKVSSSFRDGLLSQQKSTYVLAKFTVLGNC